MILRGMSAIAKAYPVAHRATIRRYASLERDPLPLVLFDGVATIDVAILQRWKRRHEARDRRSAAPELEVVNGVVAIASALRVSTVTVYAHARREVDPLPVNGLGSRRPWIWRGALEDWFERQAVPYQVAIRRRKAA